MGYDKRMTISARCTELPRGAGGGDREAIFGIFPPEAHFRDCFSLIDSTLRDIHQSSCCTSQRQSRKLSLTVRMRCHVLLAPFMGFRSILHASSVRTGTKYSPAPMAGAALVGFPSFMYPKGQLANTADTGTIVRSEILCYSDV